MSKLFILIYFRHEGTTYMIPFIVNSKENKQFSDVVNASLLGVVCTGTLVEPFNLLSKLNLLF